MSNALKFTEQGSVVVRLASADGTLTLDGSYTTGARFVLTLPTGTEI